MDRHRLKSLLMTFALFGGIATGVQPARCVDSADAATKLPRITPQDTRRHGAAVEDVRRVLESTAEPLWRHFPKCRLAEIEVELKGGPIVLYDRGPGGKYCVRLNTGEAFWCQYAYQFAHEFCHILCKYDRDANPNKWFEESLCEVASLFAIRRMAETWQTDPPYPHWKDFSRALDDYADNLIKESQLPGDVTFRAWFRCHRDHLHGEPSDRPKNRIVANQLLPHFEKTPEHWEAVRWLNVQRSSSEDTFEDYFEAWHGHAPPKHRAFIESIAKEFSVTVGR